MEYISAVRTSGFERTTGNITPIMKNTVVAVIEVVAENIIARRILK